MGNAETEYQIDNRTREDFIGRIKELSASYVPEWKFDLDNPDPLSVIARIYANQTEENVKKLNMILHKYHIEFANMYGMSRKRAIPAKTICTLNAGGGSFQGVELKKGAQVIGETSEGDELIFAFQHDISVIDAELTDVIAVSETEKKAVAYEAEEGFPLFACRGEKLGRQAVVMSFGRAFDTAGRRMRLRFYSDDGNPAALFADGQRFVLSCLSGGEVMPFDHVRRIGEFVEFWNDGADGETFEELLLEMTGYVEENVALNRMELFMPLGKMRPEFLWNGRGEMAEETFLPFTEQPSLYSEFFIGQDLMFGQPGAEVILSFSLAFERFTANRAVEEPKELKIIRKKPRNEHTPPHYRCAVQNVTFEYFNGRGWKRLEASFDLSALFAKEENAGTYEVS